jgi:exodeoxyribonuclease V alpha subunit
MQTLIGQIDKIIYENGGFFIASLKSGEKISAHYHESDVEHLKDAAITLKGSWEIHKNYGKTFKAESLNVNQNPLFFFLNRVVKGFTKKLTADLIEKYSQEGLIEILENDVEKLLDVKGMNEKRVERLKNGWKQFRSMRALGEFLAPYGVTPALLRLIATALKEVNDPIEAIKRNPYGLMRINGIGFKKADEIALNMKLSPTDPRRIGAAMEFVLAEYCDSEGNSCIEKETLFSKLELLVNLGDQRSYEEALDDRIHEGSIVILTSGKLALDRIYEAEKFLLDTLKKRSKSNDGVILNDLEPFLKEHELHLGDQQREALELINRGIKVLLLVGYAGTGKSTTAKALLELLTTKNPRESIITCALSGIAAQRIRERSGYESATIQSLLVKYESQDAMPYSVVLIDEASMINSTLFARLLSKIDSHATIVIVGDDAQLPPIGAGSPLSDFITLGIAPKVTLTHIYRQRSDQAIAIIANDIRQGLIPQYREEYEDFTFEAVDIPNRYALKQSMSNDDFSDVVHSNAHNILAQIATYALQFLSTSREYLESKRTKEYLNHFQVITPMRGHTLGVDNLNILLQEYFNPNPKKKIKTHRGEFRLFDKVVHIRNENMPTHTTDEFKEGADPYERRVFNGMCGLLFKIDEEEESLSVFYPNEELIVHYTTEGIRDLLDLSYALSIHKVQGMEYENVVVVMSFSHLIMLNTKLLYTAITRAKKQCILIGESGAFEMGCRRLETTKRLTVLQELVI